jgi:hypothetical protein
MTLWHVPKRKLVDVVVIDHSTRFYYYIIILLHYYIIILLYYILYIIIIIYLFIYLFIYCLLFIVCLFVWVGFSNLRPSEFFSRFFLVFFRRRAQSAERRAQMVFGFGFFGFPGRPFFDHPKKSVIKSPL